MFSKKIEKLWSLILKHVFNKNIEHKYVVSSKSTGTQVREIYLEFVYMQVSPQVILWEMA